MLLPWPDAIDHTPRKGMDVTGWPVITVRTSRSPGPAGWFLPRGVPAGGSDAAPPPPFGG